MSLPLTRFWFVVHAASAAFLTYFCMYAYRKPFTAASFDSAPLWLGVLDYKIALIIAQLLGYALSKVIGIKVISEMPNHRRAITLFSLVMLSQLALVLFALLPNQWGLLCLFLNGLPLGMIWGLVFSYLEGRTVTEVLAAVLASSLIIASGAVKSIGQAVMLYGGVSEHWMPAVTGMLFALPLAASVFSLSKIPAPSEHDQRQRQPRRPMNRQQRHAFFHQYRGGIVLLIFSYFLFTALRDFSDNFAIELWTELGYGDTPAIFTTASVPVALLVLGSLALVMVIRDNRRAFLVNQLIVLSGCLCLGGATLAYQAGLIDGLSWFICLSCGLYLSYIPFNCFLFERFIACSGSCANAGFLIYLADAVGYIGSVGIMLYRTLLAPEQNYLTFFLTASLACAALGMVCVSLAMAYFWRQTPKSHLPPYPIHKRSVPA
ncbi:DUF5690 family protein [Ferrimonas aestuarii]|uniref:MFS transporter n=1 Tax=Ferrimonas aestuarii TaxID=2569539 RepID=A0A4U1BQM6_9GAMM|nr:DUF5690 family protein [Ferrimonas aestuarii]TKB56632.1 MFS transporter [Ferrimonas aestuarii]